MSSGTLPPRIPAPPGHDKMNHENRKLSEKWDLAEREELNAAFKGCLEKLDIQDTLLQERAQQPQCRGVSQANRDQNTIRALRSDLHTVCDNMVLLHLQDQEYAARAGNLGLGSHPGIRDTYDILISICQQSGWSCPLGDLQSQNNHGTILPCISISATLPEQIDRVSDAIGPN
jgi:hypothetical protein